MVSAARPLPGIRVDVTPPAPVEALPRMDVAVFVGFAACGPLHLPVAIESPGQFAAVFGPDLRLAWDDARNERVYAYLGPAVRAFLANGGRRCWVIRVARSALSEAARARAKGAEPRTGQAMANVFAIPGVLAVTHDGSLTPAQAVARSEGSWSDDLLVSTALTSLGFAIEDCHPDANEHLVFRTDLHLSAGDLIEASGDDNLVVYAAIEDVRATTAGPYQVKASVRAAFQLLAFMDSTSPPPAVESELDLGDLATPPEPGQWVRPSLSPDTVWFQIDAIDRTPVFGGSPPATHATATRVHALGRAWHQVDVAQALTANLQRANLLTLDVRVTASDRSTTLSGVGLTPSHPATWWNHVSDADYYAATDKDGRAELDVRPVPSDAPRFPLCRDADVMPLAWIPLGVEPLFGPALPALPTSVTGLERDGLTDFAPDLFLDPEMAGASVRHIPELADTIRFLRDSPRSLIGMHAALSIGAGGLFNEASLLAIPDAIHQTWHRRQDVVPEAPRPKAEDPPAYWRTHRGPCAPSGGAPLDGPDFGTFLDATTQALAPPELDPVETPIYPGTYQLSWTWAAAGPGAEYAVMEAMRPDFDDEREVYRGAALAYTVFNSREGVYYYRVIGYLGEQQSSGSPAVTVQVRRDDWVLNSNTAGAAPDDDLLVVHRAALRLAAASGELFAVLTMPRHFRAQHALRYAQRLRGVRQPPDDSVDPFALDFTEAQALSYGALYLPWLQADRSGSTLDPSGPRVTGAPRVVPPDGVATGVLAARAWQRGAWIAPANELMRNVVALYPTIAERDYQSLQDAQLNLVRFDPRGIFALSADTLADDPEWRPIGVRRLMTLLRRLALRRGTTYVFEPNSPALRRAVQRGFTEVLMDLFRRGAFAGATPAQSFRVVTDDTINTSHDADVGRFLVELRVAPSLPMQFLAVRLTQAGERVTVIEEL